MMVCRPCRPSRPCRPCRLVLECGRRLCARMKEILAYSISLTLETFSIGWRKAVFQRHPGDMRRATSERHLATHKKLTIRPWTRSVRLLRVRTKHIIPLDRTGFQLLVVCVTLPVPPVSPVSPMSPCRLDTLGRNRTVGRSPTFADCTYHFRTFHRVEPK